MYIIRRAIIKLDYLIKQKIELERRLQDSEEMLYALKNEDKVGLMYTVILFITYPIIRAYVHSCQSSSLYMYVPVILKDRTFPSFTLFHFGVTLSFLKNGIPLALPLIIFGRPHLLESPFPSDMLIMPYSIPGGASMSQLYFFDGSDNFS